MCVCVCVCVFTLVLHSEVGGDEGGNLSSDIGGVELPPFLGLVILYNLSLNHNNHRGQQISP